MRRRHERPSVTGPSSPDSNRKGHRMNTMFRSYFKIALRNLIKQRGRTVISLFSLVVGLTSFILLMLCVRYELSYDSFFAHSDRVFRLGQYVPEWKFGGS